MARNVFRAALATVSVVAVIAMAGAANAHTVSIGWENSGAGSVTFWAGSYHDCSGGNEGALTLFGVDGTVYGPTQQFFSGGITCDKPDSLIDGVNNFYANNDPSGDMLPTNTLGAGFMPLIWQSVTFTGLAAGDYQFNFDDLQTTVRFAAWNGSLSSTFTLTGDVVNPVPEPATVALLGLGLLGLVRAKRRAVA